MSFTPQEFSTIYDNLKVEEGYQLISYPCTKGKVTIGIGHNCEANPTFKLIGRDIKGLGQKITTSEAIVLFKHDLEAVIRELDQNLSWWKVLSFPRQYVLISLCFNLGITKLLAFKNTLKYLELGLFAKASSNLKQSLWFKQVKSRGPKLVNILKENKL